jgi:hypothetical protein
LLLYFPKIFFLQISFSAGLPQSAYGSCLFQYVSLGIKDKHGTHKNSRSTDKDLPAKKQTAKAA